jgi:hypothetical protein
MQVQIFVASLSLNFRLDQIQGVLNAQSLNSKVLREINEKIEKLNTFDLVI